MSANNNIKENVWAMQNELRNKEGITGMDAMHHVLMILLAKSFTIEQCQKLKIPEEFAFENMIELNKKDRYDKFYNTSNMQNCVVRYLREKYMFGYTKDLPFQIKNSTTLEFMYNKISKIKNEEIMNTYDLVGDIYEHFINREGKTMKDLGQYFTDRTLIRYLVDLCDPQVNDGEVPKVWDPSAGTGGFIIEYIHHMNKKSNMINWSTEKVNIHANDINKNTYSLLMQNLYYSLGEGAGSTINLMDSLDKKGGNDQMYDFILANPPFGIKGLKYTDMCQKVKDLGINGTKGEILFLQLCMAKLKDNGKCAIVVPEGVLFNSAKMYKETRKYLLENFNLKRVIKVGEGEFFKNTGVKTSVFFFEKSGKTENVEFIQVNKANDTIEEVPLIAVEMEKIIENDYSLNMNLYKEIVLDINEDYEVFELGDIVNQIKDPLKKEDITSEYIECINIGAVDSNSNNYNLFKQAKNDYKNKSMNISKRNDILLSSVRPNLKKNIIVNDEILFNSGFINLRVIKDNINSKYLYYVINHNIINDILVDIASSTSSLYPTINFNIIKNLKIPVPPIDVQNRIVEQLDNIYDTEIKSSKEVIKSLQYSIESIMKNTMYRDDLVEYKIKDIYSIKYGDKHETHEDPEKLYPCISGGSKISKFTHKWNLPENTITIARSGSCGYVSKLREKVLMGSYGFSLDIIDLQENNNNYIYHILKAFQSDIEDLALGATVKNINRDRLGDHKFRVPPPEIQREILRKIEPKERLINQLEKNINRAEKEAKEIMNVLFN